MCPSLVRPDRRDSAFPMERLPILRTYPEFEDVPEDRPVSVYGLNEIATEKIVALQDRVKRVPNQIGSEDGRIAHRQLFKLPITFWALTQSMLLRN